MLQAKVRNKSDKIQKKISGVINQRDVEYDYRH